MELKHDATQACWFSGGLYPVTVEFPSRGLNQWFPFPAKRWAISIQPGDWDFPANACNAVVQLKSIRWLEVWTHLQEQNVTTLGPLRKKLVQLKMFVLSVFVHVCAQTAGPQIAAARRNPWGTLSSKVQPCPVSVLISPPSNLQRPLWKALTTPTGESLVVAPAGPESPVFSPVSCRQDHSEYGLLRSRNCKSSACTASLGCKLWQTPVTLVMSVELCQQPQQTKDLPDSLVPSFHSQELLTRCKNHVPPWQRQDPRKGPRSKETSFRATQSNGKTKKEKNPSERCVRFKASVFGPRWWVGGYGIA